MDDSNIVKPRDDDDKREEQVRDLRAKPIDEKDAQQVKGGRLYDDESPKE